MVRKKGKYRKLKYKNRVVSDDEYIKNTLSIYVYPDLINIIDDYLNPLFKNFDKISVNIYHNILDTYIFCSNKTGCHIQVTEKTPIFMTYKTSGFFCPNNHQYVLRKSFSNSNYQFQNRHISYYYDKHVKYKKLIDEYYRLIYYNHRYHIRVIIDGCLEIILYGCLGIIIYEFLRIIIYNVLIMLGI